VTGVVAALIERERTGTGRKINLAQMETVFTQLATDYVRESLEPGTMVARGNSNEFDAPSGVYSCTGDDAYCAITVDGNAQWQRLAEVIGRPDLVADPRYATAPDRVAHRDDLDAIVAKWATALTPSEAQTRLQEGGVPAGAVTHVADLLTDPHLAARRKIGALAQPGFEKPIPVTTGPALFENLPAPQLTPASLMAADTRDVLREVLGLSDATIDALVESGVVEAGE
jgi:crotonobetainyl-CoA:carnitine CoA-transferase CaiB-like acyl-CoA transferase